MAVWLFALLKVREKSTACCGVKRDRRFSCSSGIGKLEFSNLVFTSLSIAIEAWEAASGEWLKISCQNSTYWPLC